MYPPSFEYRRASSVAEALQLLAAAGDRGKILAGGHSLIPLMKLRLASPGVLIDIGRIPDLKGVRMADGHLVVGAATPHRDVERSPLVREHCPMLAEAASVIGDVQVRNRGTVGGNLAHADPASDLPAVAVALEASMVAVGRGGSRTLAAKEFFLGPLTTALGADEVLTEVRWPTRSTLSGGSDRVGMAYAKMPHPASGYAVVGVAAVVALNPSGAIRWARVGVTGVADRAYRAAGTEQALPGRTGTSAEIRDAAARACDGVRVQEDLFASAEYRSHLCRVYVARALEEAVRRARAA